MDIAASTLVNAAHQAMPAQATPAAADPLATARFAAIMDAAPVAPSAAVAEPATAPALPPPGQRSMGDSILAGMQSMSTEFQQSWSRVNSALGSGQEMTVPDMLRMQMGLAQMSIQYEMVSKAVSRSAQNLDQLVKLQ